LQHLVDIKAAKTLNSSQYDISVFKTTFDICRFAKGIQSSFFVRVLFENFDKSADFKQTCPVKKVIEGTSENHQLMKLFQGVYNIINMEITDTFIPPVPKLIFPEGKAKLYIKTMIKGKIAAKKELVRLYSYEMNVIYGN